MIEIPRLKFYLALVAAIIAGQWLFGFLTGLVPGVGTINPFVAFLLSTFVVAVVLVWIMKRFKASP